MYQSSMYRCESPSNLRSNSVENNANMQDRVHRVRQTIADLKEKLAQEKQLLNIEKIMNGTFFTSDKKETSLVPYDSSYASSFEATYNQTHSQEPPIYQHYFRQPRHHPSPERYQTPSPTKYPDQYSEIDSSMPYPLGFETLLNLERDKIFRELDLTNSENDMLERERRGVLEKVQAYKQQLLEVERKCKMERMHMEKNMRRLSRVSEQILKRNRGSGERCRDRCSRRTHRRNSSRHQ